MKGLYQSVVAQVLRAPRLPFQTILPPLFLSPDTLLLSFADLPYRSNQICDTNWDIMTMTTRVKCCARPTPTGPTPLHPRRCFSTLPPLSLFFLLSAHYVVAPNLLNTFLNDSYCVPLQRDPRVVDFPRLMWHL